MPCGHRHGWGESVHILQHKLELERLEIIMCGFHEANIAWM